MSEESFQSPTFRESLWLILYLMENPDEREALKRGEVVEID